MAQHSEPKSACLSLCRSYALLIACEVAGPVHEETAMTEAVDGEGQSMPVAPLRKKHENGELYCRPPEVEPALAVLLPLAAHELVERARIKDAKDPRYVPSECVLYFVRRPSSLNDESALRELFAILRQRVIAAVPVAERRIPGTKKQAESSVDRDIQDAILHKFQLMLCEDRRGYDERLDFYECRFNAALASLRTTVRRAVRRKAAPLEPLESENEPGEPSPEVESALAKLRPAPEDGLDFLYRSKLLRAISVLPDDERRVVELLLQEIPIDSKDKEMVTIVKILKCSEKTVRNRRDRAFKKLHDALKEEGDA